MFALSGSVASAPAAEDRSGYRITVDVDPANESLRVVAHVSSPSASRLFEFALNAGFDVRPPASGSLQTVGTSADGLIRRYRLALPQPAHAFEIRYAGRPALPPTVGMGGMPRGALDAGGMYLDRGSAWYPVVDGDLGSVDLTATVPEGWQVISIGKREEKDGAVRWSTSQPHDNLYLIAGPYTRHQRPHRGIDLSVWLLDDDPALAETYLSRSAGYLDAYGELIGAYPYAKFAVVENRWETGYGMPSFTLLGPRVMRLPFIPYTSLPHEILHNWWGNGVWVDYADGNWSEGLTAYLADHWMQEQRGQGSQYRLQALQRYSNFAVDGGDMPLREFVSRHNDASQSIGYSKSLMLFHMLREAMGDAAFVAGLRRVWDTHRFERVGFGEVVRTLVGGDPDLEALATQWLDRVGAPRLALGDVSVEPDDGGYQVRFELAQGAPGYHFDLPVVVTLREHQPAVRRVIRVDRPTATYRLHVPDRPLRIDIDPEYDVLRYLDPTEQPPALNRLFGAPALLVLPTAAPAAEREAWLALAAQWQRRYPALQAVDDTDRRAYEPGRNRLLLGWDNRLLPGEAARLARDDQALHADAAVLGGQSFGAAGFAVALVNGDAAGVTTGFLGAPDAAAVASLARKLPHYGSYGRLAFDADGRNVRKDKLRSSHSRLSRLLADRDTAPVLPPRVPLGTAPDRDSAT